MLYGDTVVESLVHFIAAADFQREFERFFIQHCRSFSLEDEEHSLEYTVIYEKFQSLFENRIEDFCERNEISRTDLFERCQRAQVSDVKAAHYLRVMLASVEYLQFVELMKKMRRMHGGRLDREDEAERLMNQMLEKGKRKVKGKVKDKGGGQGLGESKHGEGEEVMEFKDERKRERVVDDSDDFDDSFRSESKSIDADDRRRADSSDTVKS